jgi:hypothetical protein
MGWTPKNGEPIHLNGAFHISLSIMRFIVASTAEAKLGALYDNCQTGMIFRLALKKMGHPQPQTWCIVTTLPRLELQIIPSNNNVLVQWKCDSFGWGIKIHKVCMTLAGTLEWKIWQITITRANILGSHHVNVRPFYLHTENSPRYITRAPSQSTLKGCVGTLKGGYVCNVLLP